MATVIRRIGLSLGADLCWPKCFEDLLADLDLSIPLGGDTLRFAVERVSIEPFDLRQPGKYDLIVDRLTHWYSLSREWIKKSVILDGAYVFNNPWTVQSMEKHTTYCAMIALGLPIPKTWLVPPKEYEPKPDLQVTLERYAKLFDLGQVGRQVGYPLFMKPYDGGGWAGVSRADDDASLRAAYEKSGRLVMHVQEGVIPFEVFCRCIGLGPQTRVIKYDPSSALHERYQVAFDFVTPEEQALLEDITLTINAFFGWDFNSCEALLSKGEWRPIDFANPCPDSQVTSLHWHFPWLVKAKLRWALYCAATKRRFRHNPAWEPYFAVARGELPYREKVAAYARIARESLEADRFEDFCAKHLAHLDEVAREYFRSERAREAVRIKVEALFPEHERGQFTEHFWQAIQRWREWDAAQAVPAPPHRSPGRAGAARRG